MYNNFLKWKWCNKLLFYSFFCFKTLYLVWFMWRSSKVAHIFSLLFRTSATKYKYGNDSSRTNVSSVYGKKNWCDEIFIYKLAIIRKSLVTKKFFSGTVYMLGILLDFGTVIFSIQIHCINTLHAVSFLIIELSEIY